MLLTVYYETPGQNDFGDNVQVHLSVEDAAKSFAIVLGKLNQLVFEAVEGEAAAIDGFENPPIITSIHIATLWEL